MRTFGELSQGQAFFFLSLVLLLIILISVMFVLSIFEKAGKLYIILSGLLLVLEFASYYVLYRSYYQMETRGISFLIYVVDNIPALYIVLITLLVTILTTMWMVIFLKWNRHNITLVSVKEAIDDMDAGIVCSNEDGVPVLVNPHMEELSEYVTSRPLLDANRLWEDIRNNNLRSGCEVIDQGNTILLRIPNGRIFKLERRRINVDGVNLNELFATNITNVYKASIELQEGNERLERMNDRMRNLNDTITRVTIEKEILNMKVRVHDNLGQSLLEAKRYLVTGEGNLTEIIDNWKENIKLIDSGTETSKNDEYNLMFKTAKDVGVDIKVKGFLPQDQERKRIISTAMHECITNTIRHAGGDELYINIMDVMGSMVVEFTNNGRPPEGPVTLTGGLDMLRCMVEDYGGVMQVESAPIFKIIIKM
jgi:hypothetical protein